MPTPGASSEDVFRDVPLDAVRTYAVSFTRVGAAVSALDISPVARGIARQQARPS